MSETFPRAGRLLVELVLFGLVVSCTGELPNSAVAPEQAEPYNSSLSATTPIVETTKFLIFLRTVMATVNDPIIYATNGFVLKSVASGTGGSSTVITTPTPISTTTAAQ